MQTGSGGPRIWLRWKHPIGTAKVAPPMWVKLFPDGVIFWLAGMPDEWHSENYGPGHRYWWDWIWDTGTSTKRVLAECTFDLPESQVWTCTLSEDGVVFRYCEMRYVWSLGFPNPPHGLELWPSAAWKNGDGTPVPFGGRNWEFRGASWDICDLLSLPVPPTVPYTG